MIFGERSVTDRRFGGGSSRFGYMNIRKAALAGTVIATFFVVLICLCRMPQAVFAEETNEDLPAITDMEGKRHTAIKDEKVRKISWRVTEWWKPSYRTVTLSGNFYYIDMPDDLKLFKFAAPENAKWRLMGDTDSPAYLFYKCGFSFTVGDEALESELFKIDGHEAVPGVRYLIFFTGYELDKHGKLPNTARDALLIRIGNPVTKPGDRTELDKLLEKAEKITEKDYYTDGDHYNDKSFSEVGFWKEFRHAFDYAKRVPKPASEKTIKKAADNLEKTMENLISKSNANASELLDEIHEMENSGLPYGQEWYEDTYEQCLPVLAEAKALKDRLYKDHEPTAENTPALQNTVDDMAKRLHAVRERAWSTAAVKQYKRAFDGMRKYLPAMIKLAESLGDDKRNQYTGESWDKFKKALSEAKKIEENYKNTKFPYVRPEAKKIVKEHQTAFVGLHNAYYKELKPAGPVKIKLTISDISSAREGKEGRAGYRGEVTLSEERTVKEALSKAGFEIPTDVLDYAFYASLKELRLYINGSDVSNGGVTYGVDVRDVGFKIINSLDIQLHPGDDVHIALGFRAYTRVDQTIGSGPAFLHQYADSVKLSKFKEDETGAGIEVEAGKEFKLSTESMKAILGSDGTWSPAKGMSFFISNSAEDNTKNQKELNKLMDGMEQVMSGEDGSVKLKLYHEGWFVISAYDLEKDILGHNDNFKGNDTAGVYHGVNSGAIIRVHVTASKNLKGVKLDLSESLDSVYEKHGEGFFKPDRWTEIQTAYNTGKEGIENAETAGAARDAQQVAIKAIQSIHNTTVKENKENLSNFRTILNKLPDDISLITVSVEETVKELIAQHKEMSAYQLAQLTGTETEKYKQIAKRYRKGLPESKQYSLKVKMEADTDEAAAVIKSMAKELATNVDNNGVDWDKTPSQNPFYNHPLSAYLSWSVEGTHARAPLETYSAPLKSVDIPIDLNYAAYVKVKRADNHKLYSDFGDWCIYDEEENDKGLTFEGSGYNFTANGKIGFKVNEVEYELSKITYSGIDENKVKIKGLQIQDYSGYKNVPNQGNIVNNLTFKNALASFVMPYRDVTVTMHWKPVSLEKSKENMTNSVNNKFGEYVEKDYFAEDYADIVKIKDKVLGEITDAEDFDTLKACSSKAFRGMKNVPTAEERVDEAGDDIEKLVKGIDTEHFSGTEKEALETAKKDAGEAFKKADSREKLESAVSAAKKKISDIESNAKARIVREKDEANNGENKKPDDTKNDIGKTGNDVKQPVKNKQSAESVKPKNTAAVNAAERKKLTGLKLRYVDKAKGTMKVAWKKVAGAASYKVEYRKNDEDRWSDVTVTSNSYSFTNMKRNTGIRVRVLARTKVMDDLYDGKYSLMGSYLMQRGTVVKLTGRKKTVFVKWKKDKGVSGYQVSLSKKRSLKNALIKNFTKKKSSGILIRDAAKDSRYYVRIRAYRKIGAVRYYGDWSKVRATRVK